MIDPRRTFSDSHPPKEWSTEQEIHISSFSSRWNRPSSEIIPKPFIWTGGNTDICKDPSAHSYHNPPKPSAMFPPAKRAVAYLFMQGWQWRQPDHAQRENSNQLLGSKTQYGMLDAVGRHLQHWWYLQSCWVLMAGFLWKQANHHGHLLLMSRLSILAGLLSGSTAHTVYSHCSLRVVTRCWEALQSWGCPQKRGKKANIRLYALWSASSGRSLHLSVLHL